MRLQEYLPCGKFWDVTLSVLNAWRRLGYFPNIWRPRTFNEIILSNKLNFEGDLLLASICTDKIEVKKYLEGLGMRSYLVPTIAILSNEHDITSFRHKGPFIAKSAHGSGGALIKRGLGDNSFSREEIDMLLGWISEDYYIRSREINYKGLQRRIIIEKLLESPDGSDLKDYKIFCRRGVPFMIQVDHDRFENHTRQFYSTNWELFGFSCQYPRKDKGMPKPENLDEMLALATKISEPWGFVRVDFYIERYGVKLGEITFFPENGGAKFSPPEGDYLAGQLAQSQGAAS